MTTETKQAPVKRFPYLSILVRSFYAIQAERIETSNRIGGVVREGMLDEDAAKELHEHTDEKLHTLEKDIHKLVRAELKAYPVWHEWFSRVKGIAETLAGAVIAEVRDISRFESTSKIWAYAGLSAQFYKIACTNPEKIHKFVSASPREKCMSWLDKERTKRCGAPMMIEEHVQGKGMRRLAGYRSTWNGELKTTIWKASQSFLKVGGKFKTMYYTYRGHYDRERADWSPGRRNNAALRAVGKIFLALTWQAWRELEGLPAPDPYAIAIAGHAGKMNWKEMRDRK